MTSAFRRHGRSFVSILLLAGLSGCRREAPVAGGSVLTARTKGLVYLQTDLLDSAEAQFKTVVALAPKEPLGYTNLGLTYLRGGRLDEAEAQVLKARALNASSTDVGLLLARIYASQGRSADARAVLTTITARADADPAALFALAQLDSASPGFQRAALLRRILAKTPANLAVRVALLDAFAAAGEPDSATGALEEIRRLPPEPPNEALAPFAAALPLLRAGKLAEAKAPLERFRRAMELTSAYQTALGAVKGPDGPMVGRPSLAFSPGFDVARRAQQRGGAITDAVSLVDATADLGLAASAAAAPAAAGRTRATALAVGDFDGDGAEDIFASYGDQIAATTRLFRAERGKFRDVTAASGISVAVAAVFARFVDCNNDGYLDLFVLGSDGRARLYRNRAHGRFEDVTVSARVEMVNGATRAIFVDLDHDGDLDLVATGPQGVRALRNNADDTFTDATTDFGLGGAGNVRDAAFGDFDGDGRMDMFVSRGHAGNVLYRNVGARRFEDGTVAAALVTGGGSGAVAVGDINNDGSLDLYVAAADSGTGTLWLNDGRGVFTRHGMSRPAAAALRRLRVTTAEFVDHDNDGWLDLVVSGVPLTADARGIVLLRNTGRGAFADRSALLPQAAHGMALATVDLARDGDMDFVLADASSGVHAIRNDGGNANLFVQVRLAALRTGSGKNNGYGIGAKLELRVGNMVQTRVVTSPFTHFGLGAHLKADVLRVEWPNGVAQIIHFPGSDQDVVENEVLKSSCGFLYAWDGVRFHFVTDVMWRSALGMPMGLMGASTTWAPAGASQEYLRVSGRALQPRDGRYVLQLTEELWETSYTDEVRLLAVDHPDSVDVFVDERFIPPGPISLRPYQAVRARAPLSAVDNHGVDLLPALRDKDDVYVSNLVPAEYQGLVETHDLIMDLGDEAGQPDTYLFLRGWIYPTDASINVALSQQSRLKPQMPVLEVRDASGAWRPAADIGFPSGKDKTIVVGLEGKFPTRDHHVRLRTNMQIYWDQVFVATDARTSPATIRTLPLLRADLHARGLSRMYRKGGRYGPHWFDYDSVSTEPAWRPITGTYTRFGDVLPLLRGADDMYVVMASGDETTLEFAAPPPPPPGWTRDFLLYSDGWIKDADMNTALGNTVEPLPFHAIRQYPYAPGERYPDDPARQRYRREYNTRRVDR